MNFKVGDKIRLKDVPNAPSWYVVEIGIGYKGNPQLKLRDKNGQKGQTGLSERFEKISKDINHPHTNIFK